MTSYASQLASIDMHPNGQDWSLVTSPTIYEMKDDIAAMSALTSGLEFLFDGVSNHPQQGEFDVPSYEDKLSERGVVYKVRKSAAESLTIGPNCSASCPSASHLTIYPSVDNTDEGKTFTLKACSMPSLVILTNPTAPRNGNYGTAAPDLLRIWQIMSRTATKRSSCIATGTSKLPDAAELHGLSKVLTKAWELLQDSPDCRDKTVKMDIRLPNTVDSQTVSSEELRKGEEAWLLAYCEAKSDEDAEALGILKQ